MKKKFLFLALIVILYNCNSIDNHPAKDLTYFLTKKSFNPERNLKSIQLNINAISKHYKSLDSFISKNQSYRDTITPIYWDLCSQYFSILSLKDTIQQPLIDSINKSLFTNSKSLTENQKLVNAVILLEEKSRLLTIDKPLAPIFNLTKDTIRIYNANNHSLGDEILNDENHNSYQKKFNRNNSLYIYTKRERFSAKINAFGRHIDECSEYYYFNVQPTKELLKQEEYLFASPFKLKLKYYKNPKIDSLINKSNATFCLDCPNDWDSQTVFAKLTDFDNLYFSFTSKKSKHTDKLDTPVRGFYYVKDNIVFSLWTDEIDLFGCSCL